MSVSFSDISGLTLFQITTSAGSNHAELYANGLQQVMLFVNISAFNENYEDLDMALMSGVELQKLISSISIIDYHSQKALMFTSGDALNATGWAYTTTPGRFAELSARSISSDAPRDNRRLSVVFYVMCPTGAKPPTITLAAKIKLYNGDIIDTAGGAFNNSVIVSAREPLIYQIKAGLSVQTNTVFDYNEDYGSKYRSYCYNYTVTISHTNNINGYMSEKLFLPAGLTAEKNTRPPVQANFNSREISSHKLSFSASIYGQGRAVCYIYEDSDNYENTLGMGGYTRTVKSEINKLGFNFTSIHFYTWSSDSAAGDKYLRDMRCEFRDQYGNPGVFYATPYAGIGDEFHRASSIEFHN
ncbi:hypothetical protein [Enterobacter pseudoroggenkampii]|uniref:hypothetical protein n=1 Tax=Enterobacter pseudoroggenkampii TaxID=2996112 RepID=UPI0038B30E1F